MSEHALNNNQKDVFRRQLMGPAEGARPEARTSENSELKPVALRREMHFKLIFLLLVLLNLITAFFRS